MASRRSPSTPVPARTGPRCQPASMAPARRSRRRVYVGENSRPDSMSSANAAPSYGRVHQRSGQCGFGCGRSTGSVATSRAVVTAVAAAQPAAVLLAAGESDAGALVEWGGMAALRVLPALVQEQA